MQRSLPYTIRPMEPGDVPTVAVIERLSYPTPWPASSYLYELRHNKRSFYYVLLKPAAEAAPAERRWRRWLRDVMGLPVRSRVIGYVGFRLQNGNAEAHISTIAVHPNWRGKGLGELLLLTAMEQALDLDIGTVTLEVRASNQVAQHLYRKYRFRFAGVHQRYYRDGEDAWQMRAEVKRDTYRRHLTALRQALETQIRSEQVG
jgi:ribosomal-protein-alanine N-acetyltransferase